MKIKLFFEILLINMISISLILIVRFLPMSILRIIFGLPVILFLLGYVWISAIFPRKREIGTLELILFSFGLSIVMIPIVGLISNVMPWGISVFPLLYTLSMLILTGSLLSFFRRRNLYNEAPSRISFHFNTMWWSKIGLLNKTLILVLAVSVLGMFGIISYYIANPKVSEKYTQFYILGTEGTTEHYPGKVFLGQTIEIILGVINREKAITSYYVEVKVNDELVNKVGPFILKDREKWEQLVTFTLPAVGDNQKVKFYLYINGELESNRKPLQLVIDVTPPIISE